MQIKVYGQASKKVIKKIYVKSEECNQTILQFLRSNNIPIASSCDGDGVCQKCLINTDQLSCQLTVGHFVSGSEISIIEISYL